MDVNTGKGRGHRARARTPPPPADRKDDNKKESPGTRRARVPTKQERKQRATRVANTTKAGRDKAKKSKDGEDKEVGNTGVDTAAATARTINAKPGSGKGKAPVFDSDALDVRELSREYRAGVSNLLVEMGETEDLEADGLFDLAIKDLGRATYQLYEIRNPSVEPADTAAPSVGGGSAPRSHRTRNKRPRDGEDEDEKEEGIEQAVQEVKRARTNARVDEDHVDEGSSDDDLPLILKFRTA
ncbi:hypothetical protein LTR08_003045 [Meristemomyces frigidus]|nr:hypothetical protein LTR08_003045 [Meristemomyces frigidus]